MSPIELRRRRLELTSIDLLEISITSTPTHPNTRALSRKSAGGSDSTLAQEFAMIVESFRQPEPSAKATKAARSTAPIRVATFEV